MSGSTSFRRLMLAVSGAIVILALGFAWGFLAQRQQAFLKRGASKAGLVRTADRPELAREKLSEILSLPYVSGRFDPAHEQRGVLLYKPEKCSGGYSLYSSGFGHCSALIDMDGRVLWRWCAEEAIGTTNVDPKGWVNFFLSLQQGVFLNVQDSGIFRIDEFSRPTWKFSGPSHHDLYADAQGKVYAPEHRRRSGSPVYEGDILDDEMLVLGADGTLLDEISVFDLFVSSQYEFLLPRMRRGNDRGSDVFEPFHLNHVEAIDGSLSHVSPLFRGGNLLISIRNISCVAIVDPREKKLLWVWGPGNVVYQHHPTILENGHVLIFDNGLDRSRIVEVDPTTNRVAWTFSPAEGFFSRFSGSAQRLGNGNTLVTESDRGHAFEVTPAGEVVWRFANPEVDESGIRSGILRMTRFPQSDLKLLLARLPRQGRKAP